MGSTAKAGLGESEGEREGETETDVGGSEAGRCVECSPGRERDMYGWRSSI